MNVFDQFLNKKINILVAHSSFSEHTSSECHIGVLLSTYDNFIELKKSDKSIFINTSYIISIEKYL
ncbi:hypothetical protein [uncultured Cetobacterium sp.]|uniref:hypothetical protein n=1 Tax=uncultured Cetobacterium sp. TaxID=527638 RepID=UPI00260C62E4|nr:hypothetical protein [uncultured Cetobacterium sp.]